MRTKMQYAKSGHEVCKLMQCWVSAGGLKIQLLFLYATKPAYAMNFFQLKLIQFTALAWHHQSTNL